MQKWVLFKMFPLICSINIPIGTPAKKSETKNLVKIIFFNLQFYLITKKNVLQG
jgi:hypothetical protein